MRVENVRRLVDRLGDNELARKLERAVANDNPIVALAIEDRQRILDVLEQPSMGLAELRNALQSQFEKHARRERMRYGREAFARTYVSTDANSDVVLPHTPSPEE